MEQGTLCTDTSERVPLSQLCLPEIRLSKDRSPAERLWTAGGEIPFSGGQWVTVLHETVAQSNSDGTGAKPGAGDARRGAGVSDGLGNQSDASRGHRDQPGIRNRIDTSGDAMQTVSTQREVAKLFNSPVEPAGWPINDEGESGKHADTPNMRAGKQSVENHANTAGDGQELECTHSRPRTTRHTCQQHKAVYRGSRLAQELPRHTERPHTRPW